MGIFWYRVHQYWAVRLHDYYAASDDHELQELAEEDEYIYNRARQFTIATHQVSIEAAILLICIVCVAIDNILQ